MNTTSVQIFEKQIKLLEKIRTLSEQFLLRCEIDGLDALPRFIANRDALLENIKKHPNAQSERPSDEIKYLTDQINCLAKEIFSIDQKIISKIEIEKSKLYKEMIIISNMNKTIKRFKSFSDSKSGKTLDSSI
jgi:hypothetical protein